MSGTRAESSARRSEQKPISGTKLVAIVGLIVAVIVIALIIFLIIWTTKSKKKLECAIDADCKAGETCTNGACVGPAAEPSCTAAPSKPYPISVVYDREVGDATVSWGPVSGGLVYNLYRKLGDPSVGKTNYDEKSTVTGTAKTYTGLPTGTHYFAVTAINECGESDESSPVVLVPSCDVVPTTPVAPIIAQDTDNCSSLTEPVEYNLLSCDEATGANPFNLIRGNGQFGVEEYFAVLPAPSGTFDVYLACTGQPVSYTAVAISTADYANLTYPTDPMVVGSTVPVTWEPLLGAEEYAVTIVTLTGEGSYMFTGGVVPAPQTSLTVATLADATLVFASVIGYRLCDKSATGVAGFHIAPVVPP
jgi:hypothetical protein